MNKALLTSPGSYVVAFGLIGVASIGIYGTLYKHINALRLYATLTLIIGLSIIIGVCVSPRSVRDLDILFKNDMNNYNWNAELLDFDPRNILIDSVQATGCCGYYDYKDWIALHPISVITSLPYSCCTSFNGIVEQNKQGCNVIDMIDNHIDGCENRLDQYGIAAFIILIFYGLFHVFLSFMTFVISFCNLTERHVPRSFGYV